MKKSLLVAVIILIFLIPSCKDDGEDSEEMLNADYNNEISHIYSNKCIIVADGEYSLDMSGLFFEKDNIIYYSDYFDNFKIKSIDKNSNISHDVLDINGENIYGKYLIIIDNTLYYLEYLYENKSGYNYYDDISLNELNLENKENRKITEGFPNRIENITVDLKNNYYYFFAHYFGNGYIDLNSPAKIKMMMGRMVGMYDGKTVVIDKNVFFDEEPKENITKLMGKLYISGASCTINNNYLYMPGCVLFRYDLKEEFLEIAYQNRSGFYSVVNIHNDEIFLLEDDIDGEEKMLKYNITDKNYDEVSFDCDNGIIFMSNIDGKVYCIKDGKII